MNWSRGADDATKIIPGHGPAATKSDLQAEVDMLKDGRAKVEIALARGKKQYDKRQTIAKRDAERDIERALKDRGRDRDRR